MAPDGPTGRLLIVCCKESQHILVTIIRILQYKIQKNRHFCQKVYTSFICTVRSKPGLQVIHQMFTTLRFLRVLRMNKSKNTSRFNFDSTFPRDSLMTVLLNWINCKHFVVVLYVKTFHVYFINGLFLVD